MNETTRLVTIEAMQRMESVANTAVTANANQTRQQALADAMQNLKLVQERVLQDNKITGSEEGQVTVASDAVAQISSSN